MRTPFFFRGPADYGDDAEWHRWCRHNRYWSLGLAAFVSLELLTIIAVVAYGITTHAKGW